MGVESERAFGEDVSSRLTILAQSFWRVSCGGLINSLEQVGLRKEY